MLVTFQNLQFEAVVASDNERDGLFLEVCEGTELGPRVLEIFYSHKTNEMTLTVNSQGVSLDLVEWAIETAKVNLVRVTKR